MTDYYVLYALIDATKDEISISGHYYAVGYYTELSSAREDAEQAMRQHRFQPLTVSNTSIFPIDYFSPDKVYGVSGVPKMFIIDETQDSNITRTFLFSNNAVTGEEFEDDTEEILSVEEGVE